MMTCGMMRIVKDLLVVFLDADEIAEGQPILLLNDPVADKPGE